MYPFILKPKSLRFFNFVFIALALSFCLLANARAAGIERYDFGDMASKVTKAWDQDVALYVAKRFAVENGSFPNTGAFYQAHNTLTLNR
ncbi:hypothetical protein A9E81_09410 [Legionella pneumophila]|nr:hypothetical protein [Legionella pneumophila]AOU37610.1 hypothetical protein A9E81_09410 [Legionella pneumophila]